MTTATSDKKIFDVEKVRQDFPILHQYVHNKPLVYLDNAASAQKPRAVIDAIHEAYSSYYSNVHRGVHLLSEKSTEKFEYARNRVKQFINAKSLKEIIFVRGTTEAINLVAQSYGRPNLKAGDEIIISAMEHHSNIVPWQLLAKQTGAVLKVIPMNEQGELIFSAYEKLLNEKTKLVAITHISNALGTINPIKKIIRLAHDHHVPVLIDGAQGIVHKKVDVQELDCDFYAFSGHKLYGPSGIGVLYGKEQLLDAMEPYQGGGEMISMVTFEKTTYAPLPHKFEAGTPHIVGAIGLAAAIDYLESIGLDHIAAYEAELESYAENAIQQIDNIRLIGTAQHKASILSFILPDIHAHDLGTILDRDGIAIRSGHHCAMPVMDFFKVPATARASFAFYNTKEEIDRLVVAIQKAREIFNR